jgi:diguanylate cyclase (GGDEF)-like protein
VPVEPVVTLIILAVLANLIVMAIVVVPSAIGRRNPVAVFETEASETPERRAAELAAMIGGRTREPDTDVVPPVTVGPPSGRAYDRVVRIVSWGFIFATGAIVAVTGHWQQTAPAIFILLGIAGVLVLILHDLLPEEALGTAKFIVEGSLAITFATLLIVLTGREQSPFFFVYPLIVAGAALVVTAKTTLVLTAIASVGYIVAVGVFPSEPPVRIETVATVGINLIALILLSYVAVVIAREQRRARDAAIRLSTVDSLTGLFNRAFFFAALEREIARSARSGRGFCLLMMDLDELKDINDRHGHFVGDRVLRGVGEVIQSGVRRIDLAARYAGDEFVVLLPETDPTGAWVLAEKIRFGVNAIESGDEVSRPSVSIGVVSYPSDGATADELMITADQAMYASKRAGKNRVMRAPSGTPVMSTESRTRATAREGSERERV